MINKPNPAEMHTVVTETTPQEMALVWYGLLCLRESRLVDDVNRPDVDRLIEKHGRACLHIPMPAVHHKAIRDVLRIRK